ncbi:MAG: histidine phosphatase family protein [Alphaproteobacteria bacterium]|nr:MAG: histidine phosphatase family protein [Alphaproteobacteria bacterium]
MPLPLNSFYYIRHGQSESNAARIMAGCGIDTPLTEMGRQQARDAAQVLARLDIKPQYICYSPLLRAAETAEIINDVLDLPMMAIADLREHFVGDWEGMPWEVVAKLWEDGGDPPNGETFDDFYLRVKSAMQSALVQPAPLVVAHGGVWQAIKSLYAPANYFELDNAVPHHFEPVPEHAMYPWRIHKLSLCAVSGDLLREEKEFSKKID